MFANKYILLSLLILVIIGIGCTPSATPFPTTRLEPIVTPVQQQPISTVFIGIPPVFDPLIQSENENKEEFIVRIAATKIIGKRPILIAPSEMVTKRDLWLGVSPDVKVIEECWILDIDSKKQCATEDIGNYIGNPDALKIFFAPVYSDSSGELFVLDYYHPPAPYDTAEKDMQDTVDGYRLVIELKDGKWVEKSLTQVY